MKRRLAILLAAFATFISLAIPASAQPDHVEVEMGVGNFYGEFGGGPNYLLFVGGSAEDFCIDNPDDPFSAEPGAATYRIIDRPSGVMDITTKSSGQPLYLYSYNGEVPDLLFDTCDAIFDGDPATVAPEPLASGTGLLEVDIRVLPNGNVHVFNSASGVVSGDGGSQWYVKGWADFHVVGDEPTRDPADFVHIEVQQLGS